MLRCRLLFPVIMLMLLNGCGTVYKTADQVTAATTINRDNYAKHTWIEAPLVGYDQTSRNRCVLRSLVLDSGARTNQLYVIYRPYKWAFLDRAYDNNGQRLNVLLIGRDVSSYASLSETVAVQLDDAYLRNAAAKGIDIKVAGNHGGTTVKLPPHYVQGFLVKLDEFLARR